MEIIGQLMFDGASIVDATKRRRDTGEYRSRVFTDRPDYADFDAPHK